MSDAIGGSKRYLLVDGHGLAFRGFYALPEMNAPDGTPTNAVLGFMNMLLKALEIVTPDAAVIFFDPKGKTWRHEVYESYKGQRKPAPDAFKVQLPLIMDLLDHLGYPVITVPGMEADDLMASFAVRAASAGDSAVMLSADKDLMQILRPGIRMIRPSKGVSEFKEYDDRLFIDEFGFSPPVMADYLALAGDASDNIPGVPGIGEKTAKALLGEWGSLDAIYENIESIKASVKNKLEAGREAAELSKRLSLISADADLPDDAWRERSKDEAGAYALCAKLGLRRLIDRLGLKEEERDVITVPSAVSVQIEDLAGAHGGLAMAAADDGAICLMAEDGRTARADIDAAARVIASGDAVPVVDDLRGWLLRYPALPLAESAHDVSLTHYFFHPDAKSHALEDICPNESLQDPEIRCAALLSLYRRSAFDPMFDAARRVAAEIDRPLIPVLIALEKNGLYADIKELTRTGEEIAERRDAIESEIAERSGHAININSPKQVGELLFEKLSLPVIKKTKTGPSTDASVLEALSRLPGGDGAIPSLLLEHRECSKMLSGFIEPFAKHADSSPDGRIHSTFLHDATGTGRLASRDPNVQNMPVFGTWAERFRRAIRPRDPDSIFVAADYSQIELRVLAHLSGEERLIEAFACGQDIHRETASWVFGMPADAIDQEQRRFAKTVNFGLIYGMGAHGLAERMGIPRHQAVELIDRYFAALPAVRDYLSRSSEEAKNRGRTESVFGRIRPLAELSSGEGRGAAATARAAVNTPIQSTASDIAKIAMIRFDAALKSELPSGKLVLQVHDSLICEVPADDVDRAADLLADCMESVRAIDVPLKVEVKRGKTMADV